MHPVSVSRRRLAAMALAGLGAGPATAQESQARPIRWLVGYPPGGGSDVITRTLANAAAPSLRQPIVVENRPGASTALAAEALAKSPPDGNTIMNVEMGTMVYNRALFPRLPYDPERDFRMVSLFARFNFVLAVHPSLTARSVAEFVTLAKARPGALNYGTPSIGVPHHIGFERFKRVAGIDVAHVHYRGAAAAATALVAGDVQALFLHLGTGAPHLGTCGRLHVLASV